MIAQSLEVTRSEDDACTWPASGGVITGKVVNDLFPDPTDASLVLAVVVDAGGSVRRRLARRGEDLRRSDASTRKPG